MKSTPDFAAGYRLWYSAQTRAAAFLIALCGFLLSQANAQVDVSPLLKRIPDGANTVAVIRVSDVLKSPKAVSEHWADPQGEKLLFGSGILPPWADTLVVGSKVRMGAFTKEWSAGILPVPPQFSLESVARRESAHVEEVGGHRAVRGQRDAYFVDLGERVLGIMSPAYRPDVARWVRGAGKETRGGISEYLAEAAATPSQILLAVDLQDTFESVAAHQFLNAQPILKTAEVPVVDVIDLMKTLRGVRVSAVVNDMTEARISLDFSKPVTLPADVLKALTVASISDHGLHIPELERATPVIAGKTFALNMEDVPDPSLRAILSLIVTAIPEHTGKTDSIASAVTVPSITTTPSATALPGAPADAAMDADATGRYFNAVNKIIDDLEKSLQHIHNYVLTATYHDNYAARIEHLPVTGVSSQALEYGARVSSRLRGLAASLRGVMVTVNVDEGTLVYNASVNPSFEGYGVWGYTYRPPTYNISSNLAEVRAHQAEVLLKGEAQREQIWELIREDRNLMLRHATQPDGTIANPAATTTPITTPAAPQPKPPAKAVEPKP
jgi:hypothetical protein